MCMLNLNCKILGEILDSHPAWVMCMLNLNFKILGEILVCHTTCGVNHLLTMCMLSINFKILVRSWSVILPGESIIFSPCAC